LWPWLPSRLVQLTWAKQVNLDLDLFWQKGGPDGNVREMIFMNNKFPGPELRIDQGDSVEVGFAREYIVDKKRKRLTTHSTQQHVLQHHNSFPWD
jgi:hypothetical protein